MGIHYNFSIFYAIKSEKLEEHAFGAKIINDLKDLLNTFVDYYTPYNLFNLEESSHKHTYCVLIGRSQEDKAKRYRKYARGG